MASRFRRPAAPRSSRQPGGRCLPCSLSLTTSAVECRASSSQHRGTPIPQITPIAPKDPGLDLGGLFALVNVSTLRTIRFKSSCVPRNASQSTSARTCITIQRHRGNRGHRRHRRNRTRRSRFCVNASAAIQVMFRTQCTSDDCSTRLSERHRVGTRRKSELPGHVVCGTPHRFGDVGLGRRRGHPLRK